jgi:hypothetical protein
MKKLLWKAAKLASCRILGVWVKSVAKQVWWAIESSGDNVLMARQKIESIFFHIQVIYVYPYL